MSEKGLSPIVAAVVVLAISVAAIAIVLQIGLPTITEAREFALLTEAKGVMQSIDNAIREVAAEGEGSTRRLSLQISGGRYYVDNTTDEIRFEMETESEVVPPCVGVREGRILLNSGGDVTAEKRDANSDGTKDLVLENSKIMFVVNDTGTEDNRKFIDTKDLILKLRIKDNDVNVTPSDSSIILDGLSDSSTGTGYTEIIDEGTRMGVGRVKLHLASDANIDYDVTFTLNCGDYIKMDVRNAVYR